MDHDYRDRMALDAELDRLRLEVAELRRRLRFQDRLKASLDQHWQAVNLQSQYSGLNQQMQGTYGDPGLLGLLGGSLN